MTTSPILTVAAFKGGAGKTTASTNIGCSWAMAHPGTYGLVIDLDPQGNASEAFESLIGEQGPDTAASLLAAAATESDIYVDPERLTSVELPDAAFDLMPAGAGLTQVEEQLGRELGGERALARILDGHGYDWIVIDTRPSDGRLTLNAVIASTHVIGVVNPARWSAEGGVKVEGFIRRVSDLGLANPTYLGAVVNKVEGGKRTGRDIVIEDLEAASVPVLRPSIPLRSAVTDAELVGSPVVVSDRRSVAAKAYRELADNVWTLTHKKGRRK